MKYTDEEIKEAIEKVKSRGVGKIVRHHKGFIIIAQDENDFYIKQNKIIIGDVFGFYTIEMALQIK